MIRLSHRQKQVLKLLADGFTDDEMGAQLGISPRTARAHVEALKNKLGVSRRREILSAFHRLTGRDPFENET
jgi:DNA-binding CsgD family transcriptional regulator